VLGRAQLLMLLCRRGKHWWWPAAHARRALCCTRPLSRSRAPALAFPGCTPELATGCRRRTGARRRRRMADTFLHVSAQSPSACPFGFLARWGRCRWTHV